MVKQTNCFLHISNSDPLHCYLDEKESEYDHRSLKLCLYLTSIIVFSFKIEIADQHQCKTINQRQ